MSRSLARGLLAAALVAPATPIGAARPDPADPAAQVPRLSHRSALDGYRRLDAVTVQDWRRSNETTARIGGWRAYLREAQAPEPAASAASATPGAKP